MEPIFKEKSNFPDFLHDGWLVVPINPDKWSFNVRIYVTQYANIYRFCCVKASEEWDTNVKFWSKNNTPD